MPDNLFIPSVDMRIVALEEYNRRQKAKAEKYIPREDKPRPCITLSREFGCEAYPAAEKLCELMRQKTGEEWLLMDKALLDELARRHNLSREILENLGDQNRFLNEFLATFSSRWASHEDYFRSLSRYILSLGNRQCGHRWPRRRRGDQPPGKLSPLQDLCLDEIQGGFDRQTYGDCP